jgi:hypothetical protein
MIMGHTIEEEEWLKAKKVIEEDQEVLSRNLLYNFQLYLVL